MNTNEIQATKNAFVSELTIIFAKHLVARDYWAGPRTNGTDAAKAAMATADILFPELVAPTTVSATS